MEGKGRSRLGAVAAAAVLAVALASTLGGVAAHRAAGDPGGPDATVTEWGTQEVDQTAPTGDESAPVVDTPAVSSYDGGTSYATATWPAAAVNGPNDMAIVTSTAPGTVGISGVVTDSATGAGVGGAKVTLSWSTTCTGTGCTCFGCLCPNPCLRVRTQATYTDSRGGYAFVDTPDVATLTFTVTADGFGSYTAGGMSLDGGKTYEMSAALSTDAQTFDESGVPDDPVAPLEVVAADSAKYGSNQRIPPFIRVAMYAQTKTCAASGTSYSLADYGWDFYLTHVFEPEIGGTPGINADSGTANAEAQNSFAWYWRIHSSSSPAGSDVTNTTSFQCFKPDAAVNTTHAGWVATAEKWYVGKSDQTVQQTNYLAGSRACSDTSDNGVHLADKNNLSQNGSILRGTSGSACYQSSWKDIDQYYYTGTVQAGLAPPTPKTSYSRPSGKVSLGFTTSVNGSDSAWTYVVDRFDTASNSWKTIATLAFTSSSNSVPTSYSYATTKCQKYRVKATNPLGSSAYASFNNGSTICPG